VRFGHPLRAHLVQNDANASIGELPGGFRAGKAAADHMDAISLGGRGNHARSDSAFSEEAHRFALNKTLQTSGTNDNARSEAGVIRSSGAEQKSVGVVAGCNARNVCTIEADIGQFAIAKLGQFADIALIVAERLNHADERE
jgi:phosphotransferase system HPr-like phosphotransfer protein